MADQPLDDLIKRIRMDPRVKSVSPMPYIVTTRGDEISKSHIVRVAIDPERLHGKPIDGLKIMQGWGIWDIRQVYHDPRNPFGRASTIYFEGCYGNFDPKRPTEYCLRFD